MKFKIAWLFMVKVALTVCFVLVWYFYHSKAIDFESFKTLVYIICGLMVASWIFDAVKKSFFSK